MKASNAVIRGQAAPIRAIAIALHSKQCESFFTLPVEERRAYRDSFDKAKEEQREAYIADAKKIHNEARAIVHGFRKAAMNEFKRKSNELRQYHVYDLKSGVRVARIAFRDESNIVARTKEGKAVAKKLGSKEAVKAEVAKVAAPLFTGKLTPAAEALLAKAGK